MPATQTQRTASAAHKQESTTAKDSRPEPAILFQKYFKSSGPRTYAIQLKEASSGNHFLVFTEGKRDPKTDEVRKSRLFVFSEDFPDFFRMLHETAQFIKANPVPENVRRRQAAYWAKNRSAKDAPDGRGS